MSTLTNKRTVKRTQLRLDAWEDYAHGTRGEHFAWWSSENLIQGQDRWAGQPLIMEPEWQLPMMCEALAVDVEGNPYWATVVFLLNRKNSKTTTLGGLGTYQLDQANDEPEILLAAGSDKQAGRLFDTCAGFARRSAYLQQRFITRHHTGEIARADGAGKIIRISSEGAQQHGWNPSLVVIDELHGFRTPKLRRLWGALTTADGARERAQVFAITTEGEAAGREESILGQLVDENEAMGETEKYPGLVISRNHESRTLIYRYHAIDPDAANPRPLRNAHADLKKAKLSHSSSVKGLEEQVETLTESLLSSVMPANPASWISEQYILRQAISPKVMVTDFLQLHAGVAAHGRNVWITPERWDALLDPSLATAPENPDPWSVIPQDTPVTLGVDASYSHDTTAVAWAWRLPESDDDEIVRWGVGARVWSARDDAPAHYYEEGGVIMMAPVAAFIRRFSLEREVAEIAFDPAFFRETAETLSNEGLPLVRMDQQTTAMRDAEQVFHDDVIEDRIRHGGDPVLRKHVASVVASRRANGSWKIRPLDQVSAIDAVVATIMAKDRCQHTSRSREPLVMWT